MCIRDRYLRYLTPYGKITVIKTLALSKLSHVALVIPSLSSAKIKKLEKIFFDFIWCKKSEKVRRDDTKLPQKVGGLGMIDVARYWTAFKFSWLRRILSTNAFRPKILKKSVAEVGHQANLTDILQYGPSKLEAIGKSLSSPFWSCLLYTSDAADE